MLTRIWSGYVWNRKQDDSGKENDNNIGVFDKKLVEQALTLINIATEMDQSGNHKMAADLYLMGLDRILYAIPGKWMQQQSNLMYAGGKPACDEPYK